MCVRHGDIRKNRVPYPPRLNSSTCKVARMEEGSIDKNKKREREKEQGKGKRKERTENQDYAVNSGAEIVVTYGSPGSRLSALVSMRQPRWKYRLSTKELIHQ